MATQLAADSPYVVVPHNNNDEYMPPFVEGEERREDVLLNDFHPSHSLASQHDIMVVSPSQEEEIGRRREEEGE